MLNCIDFKHSCSYFRRILIVGPPVAPLVLTTHDSQATFITFYTQTFNSAIVDNDNVVMMTFFLLLKFIFFPEF